VSASITRARPETRRSGGFREHGPSILVAALGSTFGVMLLLGSDALGVLINGDNRASESDTVRYVLSFIAFVFIAIAVYTAAVVVSNTFATIVAGRTRTIALLRLIGASARDQRRAVAREGLAVGAIGGAIGLVLGIGANALLLAIGRWTGFLPKLKYDYVEALVVVPVVAVVLTTWLASWIGSRRVLVVTPLEALGGSAERSLDEVTSRPLRNAVAGVLFGGGILVLIAGIVVGQKTPMGLLVAVVGGLLSFTGVVLSAQVFMPVALRLVGRLLGRDAPARLAGQNALRYPERSARTTIGLVIGVTLITMFSVAVQTVVVIIGEARDADPQVYQGTEQILEIVAIVFSAMGGFSALIAAVGMVNNLSLSVLQRTRELGLLRALGFTGRQVRRMIVTESAQLTIAAVLIGLVLGTFYGWAGAEAMLGTITGSPGLILPAIPPVLVIAIVVAAAVLTWAAAILPSRRATRVSPVQALAAD
jgi:putative ABC transport system permease protein